MAGLRPGAPPVELVEVEQELDDDLSLLACEFGEPSREGVTGKRAGQGGGHVSLRDAVSHPALTFSVGRFAREGAPPRVR
ncbi:MAG TPA: hypothetical protein VFP65_20835 [Anaeromyxobacteraceae bacterium]|nr:hypothetical protein [Anaeromyxobacteraceae bacterium]